MELRQKPLILLAAMLFLLLDLPFGGPAQQAPEQAPLEIGNSTIDPVGQWIERQLVGDGHASIMDLFALGPRAANAKGGSDGGGSGNSGKGGGGDDSDDSDDSDGRGDNSGKGSSKSDKDDSKSGKGRGKSGKSGKDRDKSGKNKSKSRKSAEQRKKLDAQKAASRKRSKNRATRKAASASSKKSSRSKKSDRRADKSQSKRGSKSSNRGSKSSNRGRGRGRGSENSGRRGRGSDDDSRGRNSSSGKGSRQADGSRVKDAGETARTRITEARRKLSPQPELPTQRKDAVADAAPKAAKRVIAYDAVRNRKYVKDEIIAISLDEAATKRAEALGFQVDSKTPLKGLAVVVSHLRAPQGMDTIAAQELLRNEVPSVLAELNTVYRLEGTACKGNDCSWHVDLINWRDSVRSCARGTRIGLLDTGIDLTHPSLQRQQPRVIDFRPAESELSARDHGTAIASLLVGRENGRITGLVPDAELFAADIFYTDSEGLAAADTVSLLKGLDWMQQNQVRIVNMSFSGPANDLLESTLSELRKQGMILVAAAGNGGPDALPVYPAAYPSVIAVTAVDQWQNAYRRANRGNYIDLAGPGVGIWAAAPGRSAGYRTGTSYAVPFVTAALAAMPKLTGGTTTLPQIVDGLNITDLGAAGRDPVFGRGLINAPVTCN